MCNNVLPADKTNTKNVRRSSNFGDIKELLLKSTVNVLYYTCVNICTHLYSILFTPTFRGVGVFKWKCIHVLFVADTEQKRKPDCDSLGAFLFSTRGRYFKSQLNCSSLGVIYGPGAAHKSASPRTINFISFAENIPLHIPQCSFYFISNQAELHKHSAEYNIFMQRLCA